MALDKSYFDDKLKEKPWRDLAFRGVVWLTISCAAAYFALRGGQSALSFLERVAKPLSLLVSSIGTFAMLLATLALALKDLEFLAPNRWGQDGRRGQLGGLIRRLSGDLLLWTLGAFSTLLSSIVVATVVADIDKDGVAVLAGMFGQLTATTAAILVITNLVRRAGPSPLVGVIGRLNVIVMLYSAVLAIGVLSIVRSV